MLSRTNNCLGLEIHILSRKYLSRFTNVCKKLIGIVSVNMLCMLKRWNQITIWDSYPIYCHAQTIVVWYRELICIQSTRSILLGIYWRHTNEWLLVYTIHTQGSSVIHVAKQPDFSTRTLDALDDCRMLYKIQRDVAQGRIEYACFSNHLYCYLFCPTAI